MMYSLLRVEQFGLKFFTCNFIRCKLSFSDNASTWPQLGNVAILDLRLDFPAFHHVLRDWFNYYHCFYIQSYSTKLVTGT